jgi:hypothetical protein
MCISWCENKQLSCIYIFVFYNQYYVYAYIIVTEKAIEPFSSIYNGGSQLVWTVRVCLRSIIPLQWGY